MTTWVYLDETKRSGYVIAAASVTDPVAARRAVRSLILPGQRRVHMVRERQARKRQIMDAICALAVTTTIYDAGTTTRASWQPGPRACGRSWRTSKEATPP